MGFTREELARFVGKTVDDLVGPHVRLLFVGINPGLWTAATNTHFCHPSNRFYPALRKAGHPPAIWLHAGSGRWQVVNSEGPALGLLDDAEFECLRGRLQHGDGLLLFTDGVVETAQRDISLGLDKLAGLGERLLQGGFDGGAHMLLDRMEQTNDDRALVVVHRRWAGTAGS